MSSLKPRRLREGSVVATVSPSLAGPNLFPHIYEHGLQVLREDLGLEVVEMEHVRKPNYYIRYNPDLRAKDINDAFLDDSIDGIFATIGGHDSIHVLPYLWIDEMMDHPKVFMGFSDTTTILSYLSLRGMVTFYGPSVMGGISQMRNYPRQLDHFREVLFHPQEEYVYRPHPSYSEGYPDWSDQSSVGKVSRKKRSPRWRALQGGTKVTGTLFGGCIEVLGMMINRPLWPPDEFWQGKILFIEASEQVPPPSQIKQIMRGFGAMGMFEGLSALLFGRWRGYSPQERVEVERTIRRVVCEDFGRTDLPVIVNMDFGHTDPQMVLPLGIRAEVDPCGPTFRLLESPVI